MTGQELRQCSRRRRRRCPPRQSLLAGPGCPSACRPFAVPTAPRRAGRRTDYARGPRPSASSKRGRYGNRILWPVPAVRDNRQGLSCWPACRMPRTLPSTLRRARSSRRVGGEHGEVSGGESGRHGRLYQNRRGGVPPCGGREDRLKAGLQQLIWRGDRLEASLDFTLLRPRRLLNDLAVLHEDQVRPKLDAERPAQRLAPAVFDFDVLHLRKLREQIGKIG